MTPQPWAKYLIYSIILILLLTFSAIFSSCETAYTSINPSKIETMIDNKEKGAKLIKKQHMFFNRTISTILIANNLVNIASSALLISLTYKLLFQLAF